MNAGILGVPHGRLTTIESYANTVTDGSHELTTAVDVEEQTTLGGGVACIEGRALRETVEEIDTATVDSGRIKIGSTRQKIQRWTDVVGLTAGDDHEGFLLVGSSDATFGFDVAGDAIIETAELDLGAFLDEHDVLGVGTAGTAAIGPIESITSHGTDVREDEEIGIGEHVRDSIRAGYLSQVRCHYDSDWGFVRCFLAASGYIEVYEPDLETADFVQFVAEDILPYVRSDDA
ncbi:hypothetical protein [Halarchaeum salinum]|uniref:Uncharacterized protein n=1 Tax=Halarchaeum salinum TaxID=489912 RepID=A0AAV3S4G7_9EURY